VEDFADFSGHFQKRRERRERIAQIRFQVLQAQADQRRKTGHAYFRVVFSVTVQKRREHGDVVAAFRQNLKHRAQNVPMAGAGERLESQYPRVFGRKETAKSGQREHNHRNRRNGLHVSLVR